MAQYNVYFSFSPYQSGLARQIGGMLAQMGYTCDYCDAYNRDTRTGKAFASDFDCLVYIMDDMPRDLQDPYLLELQWAAMKNRHIVPVKVGQPMLDMMSASQLGQRLIHVLPGMYGMNVGIQTVVNDIQSKLRPAVYGNIWGGANFGYMGGFGGGMPYTPTYTPTYTPSYTPPKPAPTLEERAAAGDADAQVKLGDQWMDKTLDKGMLYTQKEPKWKKAFEWYMKAAKAGNDEAMAKVGWLYRWGCGTDRLGNDWNKAAEWYKKAMGKGNLEAKVRLAELYIFDKHFGRYREEGLRLMEEAIGEGSTTAKCIMVGYDAPFNYSNCVKGYTTGGWFWSERREIFSAAARENNPEGLYRYGLYWLLRGKEEGIPDSNPKYRKEALTYLERARKLHHYEAYFQILQGEKYGWWDGIE